MDMDKRFYSPTRLLRSDSLASPRPFNRFSFPFTRIALWFGVVLLLTACGPAQSGPSSEQLSTETERIAQEYSASGNLDQARTALNTLEVANPHQYLVMKAEEAVNANQNPQITTALVKLAVDLRLGSGSLQTYAQQNGLVAVAPTEAPVSLSFDPAPPATPAPAAPAAGAAANADTSTQVLAAVPPITDTSALAVATSAPANSADSGPTIAADALVNVRNGPSVEYPVIASLDLGEKAAVTGKSAGGDWWQILLNDGQSGWVLGQLVATSGDLSAVAVPADIPAAPPTATPALIVEAPVEAPVSEAPAEAPAAATEAAPAAEGEATPAPPAASPSDKPYFKLVASRMWPKSENGDCRGQHLLRINVIDANGVRLNGVRLKGLYTGEIIVTGSQGKGDGIIEYDLYGTGEGFSVIQNDDGRDADSDRAEGFTTQSRDISQDLLVAGGYCTNDADCQIFYDSWGCNGHHSWEATFQRNY